MSTVLRIPVKKVKVLNTDLDDDGVDIGGERIIQVPADQPPECAVLLVCNGTEYIYEVP